MKKKNTKIAESVNSLIALNCLAFINENEIDVEMEKCDSDKQKKTYITCTA